MGTEEKEKEDGGYEVALKVAEWWEGLSQNQRSVVEAIAGRLLERNPEQRADLNIALAGLFKPKPKEAAAKEPAKDVAGQTLRGAGPMLKTLMERMVAVRARARRGEAKYPALAASLLLHFRQLSAYVAEILRSPAEKTARNQTNASLLNSQRLLRYQRTSFDEQRAWTAGAKGAKTQGKPPAAAAAAAKKPGASPDAEPKSVSLSASTASSASSESEGVRRTSSASELDDDRKLLSHRQLKKMKQKERKSRNKAKKSRSGTEAVAKASSAEGEKREEEEPGPLPGAGPAEEDEERATPFARPSRTRENCWKGLGDTLDLIPSDAVCLAGVNGFVALCYVSGSVAMGAVWSSAEGLRGSLVQEGREIRGLLGSLEFPGPLEVLCFPTQPEKAVRMGFQYTWAPYAEVAVGEASGEEPCPDPGLRTTSEELGPGVASEWGPWLPLKVSGLVPCAVREELTGPLILGAYHLGMDMALAGGLSNPEEENSAGGPLRPRPPPIRLSGRKALANSLLLVRRDRNT